MMNVSRFHFPCIQEMDYRQHFICGGLLGFPEHCKHTEQHVNAVRLSANGVHAFPKDQQAARMHTIVTAALQWQYLQTELILWIRLIDFKSINLQLLCFWTLSILFFI
jgi:hypothetical protein